MRFSGTTLQALGCRNRMNNGCGIGASFPAVSTWIAGLSQAGLISERRPSFPKAIEIESPQPRRGLFLYSTGQLTC